MPKKNFLKLISIFFKRLFHGRNIIVVSAHKVEHIPLSGVLQLAIVCTLVAVISTVSYMAGDYASARSQVAEKERKLNVSEMEKSLMDKDFALLKRDLMKVKTNGQEMSDYSKFILNQYSGANKMNRQALAASDNKLTDRIAYLEKRINDITSENTNLLYAIRERTEGKINLFEDIIATTGLNENNLDHAIATLPQIKPTHVSRAKPVDGSGQGGPFIPFESTSFNRDNAQLLGAIERLVHLNKIVNTLPIGMPIAQYQERSGFGRRVDPFNGEAAFHPGLDMAGPFGAKIFAANDGVVTAAGRDGSYGNMVDIDHGLNISTRYAHLSRILVQEGDHVKKGQVIALEGSTGRSTGPHLHYEVRYHDHPIDPKKFLTARNLYVSQIQ